MVAKKCDLQVNVYFVVKLPTTATAAFNLLREECAEDVKRRLKHCHRMTSGDAYRAGVFVWSGVLLHMVVAVKWRTRTVHTVSRTQYGFRTTPVI